jgi:hypothetical protein
MSKTAKSFRLSPQALETLAHLVGLTGSNETAIVEISLAHFRKTFDHAPIEKPKPVSVPASTLEHEKFMPKSKERQFQREEQKAQQVDPEPPPNFPEYVQPVSGKKKKRRRRH